MSRECARVSPVHERLAALGARFVERNGMALAASIGESDASLAETIGIIDLSYRYKTGFKGSNAPGWVQSHELVLPQSNRWNETNEGALLARLASSEFFIEDSDRTELCRRVDAALRQRPDDVCPVIRQDAGFALVGQRVNDLFAETCSFNFRESQADSVVMTTMAGVSVLVVRRDTESRPCWRLWCDPTMAPYLWDTMTEIALGLGGGPVGSDVMLAATARA